MSSAKNPTILALTSTFDRKHRERHFGECHICAMAESDEGASVLRDPF